MKILKSAWKIWKKFGKIVGNFQALIIFTLFYFLILWVVGITSALFSDPLHLKKRNQRSGFSPWTHPEETLLTAQNPY